jgi:hypothetical protein
MNRPPTALSALKARSVAAKAISLTGAPCRPPIAPPTGPVPCVAGSHRPPPRESRSGREERREGHTWWMPVAGEGLDKGVTNGAAARGEEARGGETPRGGELEAASGRRRWSVAGGGGEDAREGGGGGGNFWQPNGVCLRARPGSEIFFLNLSLHRKRICTAPTNPFPISIENSFNSKVIAKTHRKNLKFLP